jgi:hypothetical protein
MCFQERGSIQPKNFFDTVGSAVCSPIKADSHFFQPILLKLAGNLKNGKNRIPFFLFFFKMKKNEDVRDLIFSSFFNGVYLCILTLRLTN